MKKTFTIFALLLTLSSGCTLKQITTQEETRAPSSVDRISMFASSDDVYRALSRANLDDFKYRIGQMIRFYIIFGAKTEQIVASFDEKIQQGFNQSVNLEAVKSDLREMDCQLMELHSFTHEIEDKLEVMYRLVLERRDPQVIDWFLERLAMAPGFDSSAQVIARVNYLRIIKSVHDTQCHEASCATANFSKHRLRFPFDPFSNKQSLEYRLAHMKEIAIASENTAPRAETCLSRYPSSAEAGKNTFGKSLATGSFSITYDDGPHPKYTQKILKAWVDSGLAKPTFFWLAQEAVKNPQIVKAVSEAGAEIACHSYSHPDLGNIAKAQNYDQLNRTNVVFLFPKGKPDPNTFEEWKRTTLDKQFNGAIDTLEKILASDPVSPQTKIKKFRLPYGSGYNDPTLLAMLKARDLAHIHWMIDSLDWQDKNPLSVFERVKKQMAIQKHGIILFHDIHPQSAEATYQLIDYFKSQNVYRAEALEKAL